jgi:hypothetical protein
VLKRRSLRLLVSLLALPLLAPATSQAAAPSCALGKVPSALKKAVPDTVAAEQRRFDATETSQKGRDAFAAGVAAYVYGLPTVLFGGTVERFPRNSLLAIARLADPSSQTVVAPNHDTLYTVSRIDLSDGPLVLDAPAAKRYAVVQLLDSWTNALAYIGSGANRRRASTTVIVPRGYSGPLPAGARVVRSPSTLLWLLGRTLVDGDADRPAARALMGRYTLTPLAAWTAGARTPPTILDQFPARPPVEAPPGLAFFDALGRALAVDPAPAADACALASFATAGIGPGTTPSTGADPVVARALTAASAAGGRVVDALATASTRARQRTHNGWSLLAGDTAAFGTDYVNRAIVARVGLGANVPKEAIYPNTDTDGDGRRLVGSRRYVISFPPGQLPPVGAFWSLTLYDDELHFAPNAIDRYAIGDRTAGLRYGKDGSLKIYVQRAAPPGAQRANWLPAPAGKFRLYLRLYEPKPTAVNGTWTLPTVARVR